MKHAALPLLLALGACTVTETTAPAPTAPPVVAAAAPAVRPAAPSQGTPIAAPAAIAIGEPAPGGLPPPPPVSGTALAPLPASAPAATAVAPAAPAAGRLGTTVASLGPPAEGGLWLETPLVSGVTQGRVEDPDTGKTISVELRPSGGEPGSGSQISLEAMRELGLPLTGLPELAVFAG